jgi:hypothetical protein
MKEYEEFKERRLGSGCIAVSSGWPRSTQFPNGFSGGLPERPDAVNPTPKIE